MIVLDENLDDESIKTGIMAWYSGQVIYAERVPNFLRRLFRISEFKTKALRMGKIIRLTQNGIEYYERDRRIHSLQWPD